MNSVPDRLAKSNAKSEPPILLRPIIVQFESVGRSIFPDGIWTCDAGSLVLAYLCRKAGVAHELQVGFYHWPEESQPLHWSLVNDGSPSAEDLANFWNDELHHWLVVTDARLDRPWLIDPNGEIRIEPRAMPLAAAADRYRPNASCWPWSGFCPDTDPQEAAEWISEVNLAIHLIDNKTTSQVAR